MPVTASSLQSRISAFESLSGPGQRDPAVLQTPIAPRVIPSTPPRVSPSPSPPNLGRKSSLLDLKIDLRDWVVADGSPPRTNGFKKTPTQAAFNGADDALIHFSPPKPSKVQAPPLPPRKPSLASLRAAASSSSSSLPMTKRIPPPPVRRGDSLTVEHTYPPPGLALDISPRGHTHGSSISSFHSVSLSDRSPSPATPGFPQHATHTGSSAESFEELSASAALASPGTAATISHDWERAMARRGQVPPKLPARPSNPTVLPPPVRRAAPAPPLTSDRASLRSVASSSSISTSFSLSGASTSTSKSPSPASKFSPLSQLTARPTPIPPAPRARYDALFSSLLSAHAPQRPALLAPRRRTAAGWRGLSVDLIRDPTSPGPPEDEGKDGEKEKERDALPGPVVRVLWCRSRLPLSMLSAIWTECDPLRTGALDRDAFARGMWRIDEELRRVAAASTPSSARRRGLR
ncbi:hypothetical protein B0H15DRAFT_1023349 [Mycena belliarum]|uniref:EH domain-containing protein n=1 Tax=Mycena belliarum TaxID=1033014 RepID=A0AAD6XQN4_9AGAR|nr:hypothetical protein B0H15DRAFT_1023349 [Mycena belliae]